MSYIYLAKWILLPSFEILTNGAIVIDGDKIKEVGLRSKISKKKDDIIINLNDTFLLPGLINLHTHLEENAIRDIPKKDFESFASWLSKRSTKLKHTQKFQIENAYRLGIRESLSNGITSIGDFSKTDISLQIAKKEPARTFIFKEIYPETLEEEASLINNLDNLLSQDIKGICPFTIYSLSYDLHRALIDFCKKNNLIWSCHLAESSEEIQAFYEQCGDLFFFLTRKKPWPFTKSQKGPIEFALSNNLIPEKSILLHCNYITGRELEGIANLNSSIVLCFQYSKEMNHKPFPMELALSKKILICAATESLSCDRSINLFDELFCAKKENPNIPSSEMLKWITINPAKALGMENLLGSIEEGKFADIIGLKFPQNPSNFLLDEVIFGQPEVTFILINGKVIMANY